MSEGAGGAGWGCGPQIRMTKEVKRHRHRGKMEAETGVVCLQVKRCQNLPANKKLQAPRLHIAFEGPWPCWHPDFGPGASRTMKEYIFILRRPVHGICLGSSGKLLQKIIASSPSLLGSSPWEPSLHASRKPPAMWKVTRRCRGLTRPLWSLSSLTATHERGNIQATPPQAFRAPRMWGVQ